jgi:FAD/FMN-containing dehydrogenase
MTRLADRSLSFPMPTPQPAGVLVNDIHSQLNPTLVASVTRVASVADVQRAVAEAAQRGSSVCIAGGHHAMGAQQFGTNAMLLDMRGLNGVISFDRERGLIEVGAGIQWPELVAYLLDAQIGSDKHWGIAQKQTGADRLTIGGALAANAHGRGLAMRPFIADVESLTLVDANGALQRCSRTENAELFSLVAGGYGLFGVVTTVVLRLVPRRKLQRVVDILTVDALMPAFEQRIADGFLYGDFQFAIEPTSDDFLRRGIFSTYRPVPNSTPIPEEQRRLTLEDWKHLLYLTHADKQQAYDRYAAHYRATSGQLYWSDLHQLSTYVDDYHPELDRKLGAAHRATEVITELYVPRDLLCDFLDEAREDLRRNAVDVIYGTIRLIERDDECFLTWAKDRYVCTIFNLHTDHTPEGLERSANAFRRLIDIAAARGGSYFLTYHKHATREQVLRCYPRFPEFLRRKLQYDPHERFQSDWYRHYRAMFSATV